VRNSVCAPRCGWSGHPDRRTWCTAPTRARKAPARSRCRAPAPGQGGIVYALTRKDTSASPRRCRRPGSSPPVSRRDGRGRSRESPGRLRQRAAAGGGGDDRLRHGDRPLERALRRPRAPAALSRALPAGIGARRARRTAGECVLLASAGDLFRHKRMAQLDGPLSPVRRVALDRQLADIGRFAWRGLQAPHPRRALRLRSGARPPAAPPATSASARPRNSAGGGAGDRAQSHQRGLALRQLVRRGARGRGVARGDSEKVRRFGHEQLSVFGLLAGVPEGAVRSWIDQLVIQGIRDPRQGGLPAASR